MKRLFLIYILFGASVSFAQGVRYDLPTIPSPSGRPAANVNVSLCPGTASISGTTCSPSAQSSTDITLATQCSVGLPVTLPGSNICQGTSDAAGNAGFWLAAGTYIYCLNGPGITGKCYTLTVPVGAAMSGAATLICQRLQGIRCIDTTAAAGWNGSTACGTDIGACLNAVNADCPSTGCPVMIAPGIYTQTTAISITKPMNLSCFGGPDTTVLNYTPATGDALTVNNSNKSFAFDGCQLATSTSTTSRGIVMKLVSQADVERFHINGFKGGGIYVTGDGVSLHSLGVRIRAGLIDGYCGSSSYGMNMDHVVDVDIQGVEGYTTTDCATAVAGLIIDTGAGGIWGTCSTHEQGLSGLLIRNTNQGGNYGGSPGAIFFNGYTIADTSPGGSGVIFDSSLAANEVRFFCSECWVALAGRNASGAVTNSAAIGVDIEGGSGIHFDGGIIRGSASWGAKINSTGTEFSFTGMHIVGNNQQGTPGVGGVLVTANPTRVAITGNIIGNNAADGGNQAYGIDVSAVTSPFVVWSGNELSHNATNRMKLPPSLGTPGIDAPETGSINGSQFLGPLNIVEGSAPSGVGASDVCYADSKAHVLKCSYNKASFFNQSQTIASGTATMTTAAIGTLACGTTVTVTARGVATTDTITWAFNSAPAANPGELVVSAWPTSGNVNFQFCNPTAGSVTPNATTLNWRVVR